MAAEDRTITPGKPYRPPLPHPNQIVPKVVLLILALVVFLNLFMGLSDIRPDYPRPVRVSLAHVDHSKDAYEVLRSGLILTSPLELAKTPSAARMDSPMGSEAFALTYNAQPFGESRHLGEDLNGIGGENSDEGDPIYASGAGTVIFAGTPSEGWGNVVILQHRDLEGAMFQTTYAHLKSIHVAIGDRIHRGEQLGTVGSANGRYLAHLHFEWRDAVNLDVGSGYSPFSLSRKDGELALREQRGAPNNLLNQPPELLHDQQLLAPDGAVELLDSGKGFRLKTP